MISCDTRNQPMPTATTTKKWVLRSADEDCNDQARSWGVSPLIAELLINRGLKDKDAVTAFLTAPMNQLLPPEQLPGATEAARLILQAVAAKKRIVVFGDYDVDGTTGVAILCHMLKQIGAEFDFYVPHRVAEGYGINVDSAKRLVENGAEMIVTVDCGITAVEPAAYCRTVHVPLVVTDHHTPQEVLPDASAIVHPAIEDGYENPHLCGAGVAFKLAWEIARQTSGSDRVRPELKDLLLDMLPLAALGTIADVVPLVGENRIIAKHGLTRMTRSTLPGLQAIMTSAGTNGRPISGYDVGFKLAPRINAAGRMGHAQLAVELFTTDSQARAGEIALYLEDHNRSRQTTERKITKLAKAAVESSDLASDTRRALVVSGTGWHPGVIGIVAARLVDRYHRPAVVFTFPTDADDEAQASARSIRHFDLAEALSHCQEHLISHGGHAMAAGLRIARDRLPAFTECFVEYANNRLTGADMIPSLSVDTEVAISDLTLPTVEAIAGLGPFGVGNPKPRLATDWLELAGEPRCVGKNSDHLQASFTHNGSSVRAIGFGLAPHLDELKHHRRCRVAFEPFINEFNGRRTVEMQLVDLQFPE